MIVLASQLALLYEYFAWLTGRRTITQLSGRWPQGLAIWGLVAGLVWHLVHAKR